jgi:hypothetical protein
MSVAGLLSSPPPVPMRRFTVDEFHKMIEAGVFHEDDHIELLEGWIVEKMVHNPRHDATLQRTNKALLRRLSDDWDVRVQSAITLQDSEPEPDLAVVRGRFDQRHPGPSDIELLIEVADTSLSFDRTIKASIYARDGIRRYWIVNIPSQTVEVYTLPPTGQHVGYPTPQVFSLNDSVPLQVAGLSASLPVSELFGG